MSRCYRGRVCVYSVYSKQKIRYCISQRACFSPSDYFNFHLASTTTFINYQRGEGDCLCSNFTVYLPISEMFLYAIICKRIWVIRIVTWLLYRSWLLPWVFSGFRKGWNVARNLDVTMTLDAHRWWPIWINEIYQIKSSGCMMTLLRPPKGMATRSSAHAVAKQHA